MLDKLKNRALGALGRPKKDDEKPSDGKALDETKEQEPVKCGKILHAQRKIACPTCGARKTSVRTSRGTVRYRQCLICAANFITEETVKKDKNEPTTYTITERLNIDEVEGREYKMLIDEDIEKFGE